MIGSTSNPEAATATEQPSGHTSSDRWLTVQEVADRLHVSRDTVERWIHMSELRAANVGTALCIGRYRPSWRVPNEALEEFLNSRFNKPTSVAKPRVRRQNVVGSVIEFIK